MSSQAIMWVIGMGIFNFCRFYMFPKHAYNLFYNMWGELELYVKVLMVLVLTFMTFFNVLTGLDGNMTLVTRFKTALNGGIKNKE